MPCQDQRDFLEDSLVAEKWWGGGLLEVISYCIDEQGAQFRGEKDFQLYLWEFLLWQACVAYGTCFVTQALASLISASARFGHQQVSCAWPRLYSTYMRTGASIK